MQRDRTMSLFRELQRRNVIRVATAYVVAAWLVIQVAETVLPAFDLEDAVRHVIVILAIGFVPAVIGAWIFQFTPKGLQRDTGEEGYATDPAKTRLLDRSIIVVLLIGISYFAIDKWFFTDPSSECDFYGDCSIAVLWFDNMSPDPEQDYLADGIAEEIRNLLGRIRDLRVISRFSIEQLRGQNLDVFEIAERLDVAHVLSGSIRKFGTTVRVTAQLVDVRTDRQLWSDNYTRELDNAFEVQDEIAASVVKNLQIEILNPLPKSRFVDPEVRSLLAQARQIWEIGLGRGEGGQRMHALVTRALEIEPDYVPALNLLALANYLRDDLPPDEADRFVAETRERVRELDPDDGFLLAWDAWDRAVAGEYEDAAALYLESLSRDLTDSNNIRLAGYFARQMGKFEAAVRLGEHSVAIDPLCHQCRGRFAESLMFAGDYERALQQQERFVASTSGGQQHYVQILLLDGQAEKALEYVESLQDEEQNEQTVTMQPALEAMARYSLGETKRAEELLAEVMASDWHDQRSVSFYVAQAAAWMGKKDLAFERLFEMQSTDFQYLKRQAFTPMFGNLHDDPRWLEFRAGYGLSPERLDAIEFDPELPE